MARHPKPAKFEPVVTSKCASGRPLLIDSAPPTEFRATRSKHTTDKILTGARTHIRIFNFRPSTTQNPAQLIPLSAIAARLAEADLSAIAALLAEADLSAVAALLAEAEAPDNRSAERIPNRNWPANRSRRKQTIKPHLTETRITHLGSRNRISTRFWSKSRSNRKQTSKPLLPGARTALSRVHRDAVISPSRAKLREAPCWQLQRCCGWSVRRDTMDVQTITRLASRRSPV